MFAQKIRTETEQSIGIEISTGATESLVKSKEAIKQFTYVVLTNILYERSILPKHLFVDESCEGVPVKKFKQYSSDVGVRTIKRWLTGANDAIDRSYLKQLILVVENIEKPGESLEKYFFKYVYSNEDNPKCMKEADLKYQAQYFLDLMKRNLNENLKPLPSPNQLHLIAYLTYYEDVTPSDYRSPYFKIERYVSSRIPGSEKLQLGRYKTPFHKVVVRMEGLVSATKPRDAANESVYADSDNDASSICIDIEDSFEDERQG